MRNTVGGIIFRGRQSRSQWQLATSSRCGGIVCASPRCGRIVCACGIGRDVDCEAVAIVRAGEPGQSSRSAGQGDQANTNETLDVHGGS
jgi:hypothetical protein